MTIDYDKLAELLDTATPGPWRAIPNYNDGEPRPDDSCLIKVGDEYLGIMHGPDAGLAAAAPDLAKQVLNYHYAVGQLRHLLTLMADTAAVQGSPEASDLCKHVIGLLTEIMEVTQQ